MNTSSSTTSSTTTTTHTHTYYYTSPPPPPDIITTSTTSTPAPVPDLRLELFRRLCIIERYTGIPSLCWNWDVLHYLDSVSCDLWTIIVYAGILLVKSRYFQPTTPLIISNSSTTTSLNTSPDLVKRIKMNSTSSSSPGMMSPPPTIAAAADAAISPEKLTCAALSIAVKFLHDGRLQRKICPLEIEIRLAQHLGWNFLISEEEYFVKSKQWYSGGEI
jgi:hypothetical protein